MTSVLDATIDARRCTQNIDLCLTQPQEAAEPSHKRQPEQDIKSHIDLTHFYALPAEPSQKRQRMVCTRGEDPLAGARQAECIAVPSTPAGQNLNTEVQATIHQQAPQAPVQETKVC